MKHRNFMVNVHEDDVRNLCTMLINTILTRHFHNYSHAQKTLSRDIQQGEYAAALVSNENLINCLKETINELEKNAACLSEIEGTPKPAPPSPTNT